MLKKLSLLLCCAAITFCISCKFEDRDIPPTIFQENMEVSEEKSETYFRVGPRDYDMGWIRIFSKDEKQNENATDKDIAITKEITNKEATVIEISEDEKATIYCENGRLKKIAFNFITVEKTEKGTYSVKLNKNTSTQKIFVYDFAFANSHGVSSAKIYLNKKE